jgi:hypothetical protein
MAVLIPGKLVYLATPHTASIATAAGLSNLPGARATTRKGNVSEVLPVTHHASRKDVEPYMTGSELVVTTVRNPCDLVVTWWLRQQPAVKKYIGEDATFEQFVSRVDEVIGVSGPFLKDGKIFWHDCDTIIKYENLVEELNALLVCLDLPTVSLSLINVTKGKKSWIEYYNEQTLAIVRERFKEEIFQYGY